MSDGFDRLSTEWNQAQAYQFRLHLIKVKLLDAKSQGDFGSWVEWLWNYYLELCPVLYDEERKNFKDLVKIAQNGLQATNVGGSERYSRLVNVEEYLSTCMHKRGLLLPTKPDPGKSLRSGGEF